MHCEEDVLATLKIHLRELSGIYLCNHKTMYRTQHTCREVTNPLLTNLQEVKQTRNFDCVTEA